MPALRSADKISAHMVTRGTRAPEGLPPAREHGTGIYREVPLWPGITWGDDSRCLCSWGYLRGVRQVKVQSGACTVHIGSEAPLPVLLNQVIASLAEVIAEGDGRGVARCGTRAGLRRHRREKTEKCQPCRDAENEHWRMRNARKRLREQAA